jgi:predicted HTH domain antitoxin
LARAKLKPSRWRFAGGAPLVATDDKHAIDACKMGKTMSIRMDVVHRGRIMLAIERYKNGMASLGKAAELAGVPAGRVIALLAEYGVKSNLQKEDFLEGLANLRKVW